MTPRALLDAFTAAVERRDGKAFARLFTEDGVYHDGFYGVFQGRARVAELIDDWFYRTAEDFRWDMNEPVSDGRKLYAHYVFSYRSKLAGAGERRAVFEGVAMITLREGLIADYREVAGSAPTLFGLGIPPGKVAKTLGRWDKALRERPESARHIA